MSYLDKKYGGYEYTSYYPPYDDYYKKKSESSRLGKDGFWGKRTYKSSMGSGRLISSTTSYISSWNFRTGESGSKDTEQLLKKTFQVVREFVVILDFPFEVEIRFVSEEKSSELGFSLPEGSRRIFVPTDAFDTSLDNEEKINITCGLGLHEAAHILFTECFVFKKFIDEKLYDIYLEKPEYRELCKLIANILEDEVVEDKLLTARPGYQDFIKKSKDYLSNKVVFKSKNDFDEFFINLVYMLRFQDKIDPDVIDKYSDLYNDIKDIINPLPESTKETCLASKKIVDRILAYRFDNIDSKDINKWDKSISKVVSESNETLFYKLLYGVDGDTGVNPSGSSVSNKVEDDEIAYKLALGKAERGFQDKVYFEKPDGNKYLYNAVKAKISSYVPTLRKLVKGVDKNYDFSIYGCRQGLLDTNKLAEAYQGVSQVYIRKGTVKTNKTTLCVLVDESGSMGGDKEDRAVEAGILLNEAFGNQPGVDLYIYGHTADLGDCGEVNLNIYREGSTYRPKYSLSSISARCQNRDGQAIWNVAKRVRKFTQSKCIMIVISDGEPAAYDYYGECAIRDVRSYVKKTEDLGFEIIQVSIDAVPGVSRMFDNYIDISNNIAQLPKNLGDIIKKIIVKDKISTVTQ